MLLRQTILYLPAQIIGPLAQMAATIVWTYWLQPEALGAYALVWAIQELAGLAILAWWSAYMLRYASGHGAEGERARLDGMEWAVQILAALAQTVFAVAAVWTVLDIEPTVEFAAAAVAFTLTRNLASHLADRARAHFEITAYSIIQITGSLFGFLIGLAVVAWVVPTPEALLWSYAAAQAAGILFALPLMRLDLRAPRFDRAILAAAWRYGAPLFVASVLVWVGSHSIRFIVQYDLGVEAVGFVTVGWWLGLRLTTFASMLVTGASFSIAVERIREVGPTAALPQFATNSALLLAILAPSLAGVIVLNTSLVQALVAAQYVPMTMQILPLAVAAGAIRAFKNHGSDQCFLLFERTTLNIWSTVIEAVATVVCCIVGLHLGGMVGAAAGCLVAAIIAEIFSFVVANRLFGYYLRLADIVRIATATAAMALVLELLPSSQTLGGVLPEVTAGALTYGAALALMFPAEVRVFAGKLRARLSRR